MIFESKAFVFDKSPSGKIERWEEQTFNERIGLGLEFGDNIVNMLYKGRRKQTNTKTKISPTN